MKIFENWRKILVFTLFLNFYFGLVKSTISSLTCLPKAEMSGGVKQG